MEVSPADYDLPYFDKLIETLESDPESVFGSIISRNVHWGYWENPIEATLSLEEVEDATDALTHQLLEWVEPKPDQKILDVGCGFGGTIALMNETYQDLDLTGLNIDARQIERAKHNVVPKAQNGNKISFVVGDACELPFEDNSFDSVLAVECIFHFPSREKFFNEASRVLKPGGKLVLSDFVGRLILWPLLGIFFLPYRSDVKKIYGSKVKIGSLTEYWKLSTKAKLKWLGLKDITKNTLPTYLAIKKYADRSGFDPKTLIRANTPLEHASRLGALKYDVLAFQKAH